MPIRRVKNFVAIALLTMLAAIIGDMASGVVIGIIDNTLPAQGRILALSVIFFLLITALRFLSERKK